MRRDLSKYKTKSDYSLLRNRHKTVSTGTIYETNLMTISKMDEYFTEGQNYDTVYSDGNFRFTVRGGANTHKRHYRGNVDEVAVNGSNTNISSESYVKMTPNYTSMSDFVYYGTARGLFESAVNEVVANFPAELVFTDEIEEFDGEEYYIISNPYRIDLHSVVIPQDNDISEMRYFCDNYDKYTLIYSDNIVSLNTCDSAWSVTTLEASCMEKSSEYGAWIADILLDNGNIAIKARLIDGDVILYYTDESLIGLRIRPDYDIIEKYFASLEPFQAAILSRSSNPIYTAKFETIREDESPGLVISSADFTWPSEYGYNPDVDGYAFASYITDMTKMCEAYDEFKTNNISRKLTHEAIKNLDWTFTRNKDDYQEVIEDIDSSKIDTITTLYGRIYDDIKLYIDSIKNSNTVTYNKRGNTADYNISDILEAHGFDATSLTVTPDNTILSPRLYPGNTEMYSSSDANVEFMRRLILNSKYILGQKGTRAAIETMLSLFGIERDEYQINEYIVVASGNTNYLHFGGNTNKVGALYPLLDDIEYINEYRDGVYVPLEIKDTTDYWKIYNLPLTQVYLENNGERQAYVIPWFNSDETYDDNLYFQQYGGWGKTNSKEINLAIAPDVNRLTSSNKLRVYSETEPLLKFASDLNDLKRLRYNTLVENDICYVTDIKDIMDVYKFKDKDERDAFVNNRYSHYFILENKDYSTVLGLHSETTVGDLYGWRNILEDEFNATNDSMSEAGRRVVYYESIKDTKTGNNTHSGRHKYDLGESFIEAMTRPFKYAAEHEQFSWFGDDDVLTLRNYGFEPVKYVDNQKCWFFSDTYSGTRLVEHNESGSSIQDIPVVGEGQNFVPFNPESINGDTSDEAAANSIINIKNLEIVFNMKEFKDEARLFIEKRVMPYLTSVIPSTAIFTYRFDDEEDEVILDEPKLGCVIDKGSLVSGITFDAVIVDASQAHIVVESKPSYCSLTATTDASWIKIKKDKYMNVVYVIPNSNNETGSDRTGTITIKATTDEDSNYNGTLSQEFRIQCVQKARPTNNN